MLVQIIQIYKDSFGGLSKENKLLSLVMFINRCGTMVATFLTIYLVTHLEFSLSQAGIVAALFGIGSILGAWSGGVLTDKYGYRKVMISSFVLGALMFIIVAYVKTYAMATITVFLLGLINEIFRPANATAIAAFSKPENRTRSYALHRFAVNLGFAAGTVIGGVLASVDYQLLFWVDAISNVLGAGIIFYFLPKFVQRGNAMDKPTKPSYFEPWKDKVFVRFLIASTLYVTAFIQIFRMWPVYLKAECGISEYQFGFIAALNGIIIALFEMPLILKLEGRKPNVYFIIRGTILLAIAFCLLYINVFPYIFIAVLFMVLATISEIIVLPFSNSLWVSRTADHNRGSYAAAYAMNWAVGSVVAPLVGAFVADHFGYQILWAVMIVFTLLAFLVVRGINIAK